MGGAPVATEVVDVPSIGNQHPVNPLALHPLKQPPLSCATAGQGETEDFGCIFDHVTFQLSTTPRIQYSSTQFSFIRREARDGTNDLYTDT